MEKKAKTDNQLSLYRKYRPKNFKEVLGQDHIVKTLEGAIKLGNLSHAYLFTGSRGIGKTSVARIFAEAIGVSANDLYEIDAASNRGIDDVRELREAVNTLPFESPYKVYIVDEVHMLTKEAFNALLKTLEEPPKHVIFILATTELEKLPETIISRCQTFSFNKPAPAVVKNLILKVAKAEGFAIEPASAELLAMLSEGSFRDGLGVLQKIVSASADKKISEEEVLTITGAPRSQIVNDLLSALGKGDLPRALTVLAKAGDGSLDFKVYLKLVLQKLRFVLLLRYAPEMVSEIEKHLTPQDFEFLKARAGEKDNLLNAKLLLKLLEAYDASARAEIPSLPVELALIEFFSSR